MVGSTMVHDQGAISALGSEVVAEASGGLRVYVGTRWRRAALLERLFRLLRLALSGLRGGGIFSDNVAWCGTVGRSPSAPDLDSSARGSFVRCRLRHDENSCSD